MRIEAVRTPCPCSTTTSSSTATTRPVLEPRSPRPSFDLIYMDPPVQHRCCPDAPLARRARPTREGMRIGFGGRRYRSRLLATLAYDDAFADYLSFLEPRLSRARALLAPHGTLYFHIDYREAHYCKLLLDEVFGRECFLNELIWAYDYGAKPRRRWPAKHDTILVYVRTSGRAPFRRRRGRARALHGPGSRRAREGGARQTPDRRVVSHHRADQRAREDRLSDPEARGRAAADRRRLLASRWLVPGPVRRLGHARGGVPRARPALRARRLQPDRDRGHARALGHPVRPAPRRRPASPAPRAP